jgi:hypothetical protein
MERHNDMPIKDAMKLWLNQAAKHKKELNKVKIRKLWAEKMGTTINDYTKEIKIFGKRLYITIDSAPLRNELFYEREKIKSWVNNHLGEEAVVEVIIR